MTTDPRAHENEGVPPATEAAANPAGANPAGANPFDGTRFEVDRFEIGRVVSKPYIFTAENIREYATLAGDTNPLHHDEELARKSRFGALIASAAHSTGVLISVLADKFASDGEAVGLDFSLTLRRAVKVGSETDLIWRIAERNWSDKLNGHILGLEGEIRDRTQTVPLIKAGGRMLLLGSGHRARPDTRSGQQDTTAT